MSNMFRTVIFFFAVTLAYIGVSNYSYPSLLFTPLQQTENAGSPVSLSKKKINFFYLHRQTENVVNPVNYFPTPDLKNSPKDISGYALANEAKIGNILSCYFAYSLFISRSLSIGDIIFPFHYFW